MTNEQFLISLMVIISLIGLPASGKTTIMKKFLASFKAKEEVVVKIPQKPRIFLTHLKSRNDVVIGRYGPGLGEFQGTDRLSMAILPAVKIWIADANRIYNNIFFEGDRLNCLSFYRCLNHKNIPFIILNLIRTEEQMALNRRNRTQPESFIKRIAGKIKNVKKEFPVTDVTAEDALRVLNRENFC